MRTKKEKSTFVLRDYQKECIEAIDNAGEGHYLVAMATGLGKTAIFTHLDNPGRTLILSHRDELVRQPEKYYSGRKTYGVEKADEHAGNEDVVSASVQSLQQDKRLEAYPADAFDTIIVDEAHHAAADSYRKIIDHFSGARRVIGFTATPKRGDNVGLDKVFDKIVFTRDIRWGIENNYLSRIRCKQVVSNFSLDGITLTAGDYSASALEKVMSKEGATAIPVAAKAYIEDCYKKGRHTLIYCVTRNLCQILLTTIQEMLPEGEKDTIRMVTGLTPDDERAQILADFQAGKVKGIVNCMVLTEGTDLPICDTIMNLRPTCNMSLYQQMVGRGTRLYKGKDYCLVIDIVPDKDSVRRTLCTAPTLFGIDPQWLDKSVREQFTASEDLMDLCNSLSEVFASATQKIELESYSVNLFVEEVEDMISKASPDGIKQLAEEYKKKENEKKNSGADINFGNLDVSIEADEERHYRIKPNWDEVIYISTPDVLNMVRIEFDFSKGKTIVGNMKLDEAIDLARTYCESMPWYYGYAWDRAMQRSWTYTESTPAQKGKVRHMYEKTGISMDTIGLLNKLEASQMIDLATRLKDAKKYSEALSLYNSHKNTRKVQAAKEFVDKRMEAKKLSKDNDRDFALFCRRMESTKESLGFTRREKEERQKKLLEHGDDVLVIITRLLPANEPAGSGQVTYIESMLSHAKNNGVSFSEKLPEKYTKRQASAMLSLLNSIAHNSKYRGMVFTNINRMCERAESGLTILNAHYEVAKK